MKFTATIMTMLAFACYGYAATNEIIIVDSGHNRAATNNAAAYQVLARDRILLDDTQFEFEKRIVQLGIRIVPMKGETTYFTVPHSATNAAGQYILDASTLSPLQTDAFSSFNLGDKIDIMFLYKPEWDPNSDFMGRYNSFPTEWYGRIRIR